VNGAVSLKGTDGRDIDLGTPVLGGNTSTVGLTAAVGTSTGINAGTAADSTVLGAATTGSVELTGADASTQDSKVFAITATALTAGQKVVLNYVVDGVAQNYTYTVGTDRSGTANVTTELALIANSATGLAVTGATTNLTIKGAVNGKEVTITDFRIVGSNTALSSDFTVQSKAASTTTVALNGSGALFGASSGISTNDKVQLSLSVDGSTVTTGQLTVGATPGTAFAAALNADTNFAAKAAASFDTGTNKLTLTSKTTGTSSTISINSVSFFDVNGVAKAPTTPASIGLSNIAVQSTATTGTFAAVTLDDSDNLYFNVQVDQASAPTNITINKALINKTLSTPSTPVTNGTISSVADYKKVVDAALTAGGITGVTTAVSGSTLVFSTASYGANSKLTIGSVVASTGADKISVDKIDISATGLGKVGATTSDQIKSVLTAYISVINTAINKVTSAAASLGSVASRIDMQKSFVNTLMDTIDKGVGNLIDADMTEESTKLQALQVKQQLGTQALSIANQSAQSVLSLFRS